MLSDVELAKRSMRWFSAKASQYPGNYAMTSDQFITYMTSIAPSFFQNYGKAVRFAQEGDIGLEDATIKEGVERIADQSQGNVPTTNAQLTAFFDALSDQYGEYNLANWSRVGSAASVQTVKDVEHVAAFASGGIVLLAALGIFIYGFAGRK